MASRLGRIAATRMSARVSASAPVAGRKRQGMCRSWGKGGLSGSAGRPRGPYTFFARPSASMASMSSGVQKPSFTLTSSSFSICATAFALAITASIRA